MFRWLSPRLRTSIALDDGAAFARHGPLASTRVMTAWLCDAYASWQGDAVEKVDARPCRDQPRKLDPDDLAEGEPQGVILSHDLTPRRCLGFLLPAQAISGELGRDPHPPL